MSDGLPLPSLEIENFRAIRHLRLPELARVNLFVGKNNSGKTSLLQAIQLYLERNTDSLQALVLDLVRAHSDYRSGFISRAQEEVDAAAVESAVDAVEALFHGSFGTGELRPIRLTSPPAVAREGLVITLPWTSEEVHNGGDDASRRPALIDPYAPLLKLSSGETTAMWPLNWVTNRLALPGAHNVASFIPASGFSSMLTRAFWDRVVVAGEEHLVEQAVRIVVPTLERIVVVGERRRRTVLCKLKEVARPVPLESMGDGANRVFGLAVTLVQARGGAVLIDEVENGLHYSVQAEVWETIFSLAETLDVQVFATTHSWDCLVGFQNAANRSPERGVLYRLDRAPDGRIDAVHFSEEEVAVAAKQQIDIRG
jgi:AAA domain, putative AbiEii toxin, Type IV TA system/AAA ATPase domain